MSTTTSTRLYSCQDDRLDGHVAARAVAFSDRQQAGHEDASPAVSAYAIPDSHADEREDVQTDGCKDGRIDVETYSRKDGCIYGRRDRHSAFVIVLANHKGGVTKTTSTANLGVLFAEAGLSVLLVDCDPQANLSETFGWSADRPSERLEDLLEHPDAAERFAPPAALSEAVGAGLEWRERLRIIPTTDELADVAADLSQAVGTGWELRLRQVLGPMRERFDVILLDTPPGLGTLPGLALLAADGLLIPVLAADLDVRGAGKVYDLVETQLPDLRILGVLVAASESRWRITREAVEKMTTDSMRVLPIWVPRSVRVASAPRHQAPTAVLEPDSMVTHAYRKIAHQLMQEIDL